MFCGFLASWGFIEPYFQAYLASMAHGSDPISTQMGVIVVFLCFPVSTFIFPYLISGIGYKQSIRVCLLGFS